ncbi:MAG: hypothetical protein A3I05_01780 [Deltaproteobacteria bacterium RIFCSPLOWO2_02_FULL_44_10]|nr:MAG: hypothetical protein A3C46_04930 [Deltaproteobacteria bacterium RIFCSPHIGHO2_02_FULL_44_16]OGQ44941.1 MAG: hypothetical protein A3I05_01780 [Deltaproteobacteria bacterium RIFCSPLOWO2_02_FULL_44_10]
MRHISGFTLIELIVTLLLVAILAVAALPRFMNLSTEAENSNEAAVVSALRTSLQIWKANDMLQNGGSGAYPPELDSNANSSPCASCFSTLLDYGVTDNSWWRIHATQYSFSDGTDTTIYTYDPVAGTFQ